MLISVCLSVGLLELVIMICLLVLMILLVVESMRLMFFWWIRCVMMLNIGLCEIVSLNCLWI